MRNGLGSCLGIAALMLTLLLVSSRCEAQLSATFYDRTCPTALSTIRTSIRTAVSRERRMAAALIHLFFHDCFVQGCDASILLDDSTSITSEKNASTNVNSVRGYDVIDAAKAKVEETCPGVVSCADVLAVAARDASAAVGGPSWTVKLGRRDSTTASISGANTDLPRSADGLDKLLSLFARKGLNERDLVALSGAHTIGQAQCSRFRGRLYGNGTDIDAGFAATRKRRCPATGGDANLAPLDLVTPDAFDNNYFKILLQKKGLLQSDQVLATGASTASIVTEYSTNPSKFAADFASSMIKMGDISPLTGSAGQIRRICTALN